MEPCRSVSARVPFFRSPASTTAAKPRSAVSSVTTGPLPLRHLSDHYATEDTLKHLISTVSTPLDLYVARPTSLELLINAVSTPLDLYVARPTLKHLISAVSTPLDLYIARPTLKHFIKTVSTPLLKLYIARPTLKNLINTVTSNTLSTL